MTGLGAIIGLIVILVAYSAACDAVDWVLGKWGRV